MVKPSTPLPSPNLFSMKKYQVYFLRVSKSGQVGGRRFRPKSRSQAAYDTSIMRHSVHIWPRKMCVIRSIYFRGQHNLAAVESGVKSTTYVQPKLYRKNTYQQYDELPNNNNTGTSNLPTRCEASYITCILRSLLITFKGAAQALS